MIARIVRSGIACIALVTTAVTAFAFEGRVDMKMISGRDKKEMPVTYYIKGTHMRTEMTVGDKQGEGGTFATILNMDTREVIVLMEKQKTYMVNKLPEQEKIDAATKDMKAPEFKPTGRKETIAGVEAEEYVGVSDKRQTEMWVTKELGKVMMTNQSKGGSAFGHGKDSASAWQKFAEQNDFFALRIVQRAKEGAPEDMRMEVVKIEKGAQPDSLFVPPADYKKFEMPSMGDMMKGMMNR